MRSQKKNGSAKLRPKKTQVVAIGEDTKRYRMIRKITRG